MAVNPNLAAHMENIVTALTDAEEQGDHAHASVTYGACGETYSGPVTEWSYLKEDQENFGFLELLNYRGESVMKPLVRVRLHDIRPCWDGECLRQGKAVRPGSDAPLQEQGDLGYDPYAGTGHEDG